jgi:hypothetical protein
VVAIIEELKHARALAEKLRSSIGDKMATIEENLREMQAMKEKVG